MRTGALLLAIALHACGGSADTDHPSQVADEPTEPVVLCRADAPVVLAHEDVAEDRPTSIAATRAFVWYATERGRLMRVRKDGGDSAEWIGDVGWLPSIVAAQDVYASDGDAFGQNYASVRSVSPATLEWTTVFSAKQGGKASNLHADDRHVYFTRRGTLTRTTPKRADVTEIASAPAIRWLAADAHSLFWAQSSLEAEQWGWETRVLATPPYEVVRMGKSDLSRTTLTSSQDRSYAFLATDDADGFVYALEACGAPSMLSCLVRIPKDGGAVEAIPGDGFDGPEGLLSRDGNLYVLENGVSKHGGRLIGVPKDGSPRKVVAGGITRPNAMVLDDECVYWSARDGTVSAAPR
ncbi:MAG: hypothetical protein IT375_09905 [Polyangiaceae bacterium]|nr:hypothetical protein [Polyangiaceae bacterium]